MRSHCATWIRLGRGPRLDRRGEVGERRGKSIVGSLTFPGLACLDLVGRHRGLYRVSWQHVEHIY